MMTARFLIHLREWEHKAAYMSEFSQGGSGLASVINFKKTTVHDEDDETENGVDRVGGWTIHDEFGNDPVLEARMGYRSSVEEGVDIEIVTRSPRAVDRDRGFCEASSSTLIHGSRV